MQFAAVVVVAYFIRFGREIINTNQTYSVRESTGGRAMSIVYIVNSLRPKRFSTLVVGWWFSYTKYILKIEVSTRFECTYEWKWTLRGEGMRFMELSRKSFSLLLLIITFCMICTNYLIACFHLFRDLLANKHIFSVLLFSSGGTMDRRHEVSCTLRC